MGVKIVEHAGFHVVGIEARTNNASEMSGQGLIGPMWGRFMSEGIPGKIPNRVGDVIYALYTGYGSDRNGDYDFVIGARVSDSTSIPAGMVLKQVPAGTYAVVTSEKGPGFEVVPAAWQQVWKMEDQLQLGGVRAYATDFEVYDDRAQNPQAAQVDLYIGLR
ncbi:MAG TPA: GyrI-like domain-containing protein [Terriglobales bacterium]|jgi:predicted transcriptional regulator YdeE|nr:GyrI-like domain-containing protein [Terriglobales bacterium]